MNGEDVLRDPARLAALSATGLMDTLPEAAFDRVTRLAQRLLGASVTLMTLLDGERQFFKSFQGLAEPTLSERQTPLSHSLCQHVVRGGAPFVVEDATVHPLLKDNLAPRDLGFVAYLGVPLEVGGYTVGALGAAEPGPRVWTPEDEAALRDLAAVVSAELALRRMLEGRERAEAALQAREAHNRAILESITDALFTLDEDWRFAYLNPQAEALLQRAAADLLGKSIWEAFAAALGTPFEHEYRRAVREQRKVEFIAYYPPLESHFEVRAYPFAGGLSVYFNDVNARLEAEAALRESEQEFRAMFEISSVGKAQADVQTRRFLRVNEAFCRITGYSEAELLNMSVNQLNHPDDEGRDAEVYAQLHRAEADSYQTEKRYLRKDGSVVWVNVTGSVIHDAQGKPLRTVAVIQDITERRANETALRESEARFRAVQQATPDGFMIFESVRGEAGQIEDFRWLYTNPAAEGIIGQRDADLRGKQLLVEMPGNRDEGLFDAYVQVVETGQVWQREFHYPHEGMDRWFRSTAARTGDGFAVAFSDVSVKKRAEKNLALLATFSQELTRLSDQSEIVAAAGALLGEHLGLSFCALAQVDEAANVARITLEWRRAGVLSRIGVYPLAEFLTDEFSRAARAGKTVVVHDTEADSRTNTDAFRALDIGAFASVPLHRDGRWQALFSVYRQTALAWRQDETEVLEELTQRLWTRLERVRAEEALRESEERYRSLFETMDQGFCIAEVIFEAGKASDYRFVETNPVFEKQTGLKDAVGKTARELVPNLESHWFERYGRVALTGEAVRFVEGSDAMDRWFDVYASRVGGPESHNIAILFTDITERKRSREILERQAEMLRLAHDAIFVWRLGGAIETWNQGAVALYGYSEPEALGRVSHELLRTEHPEPVGQLEQTLLERGQWEGELHHVARDGRELIVSSRHQLIAGEGGAHLVLEINRDITESRRAERRLSGQNRTLEALAVGQELADILDSTTRTVEALLPNARASVLLTDPEGAHLVSGAARSLPVAYSAALEGIRVAEGVGSCGTAAFRRECVIVADIAHDPLWTEFRELAAEHALAACWSQPILAPDGKLLGTFAIYFPEPRAPTLENLSDLEAAARIAGIAIQRKQAEEALERARAGAEAAQEQLRALVDNLPELAWWARPDGFIDFYNRRWYEYTGTTFEDMEGWGWQSVHDPDMLAEVVANWQYAISTGQPFEMEFPIRGADGDFRWFLTRVRPLRDAEGNILRWIGMNTDIHDRRQAEEVAVQASERLGEANRTLEQRVLERTAKLETINQELAAFNYSVSHDLRAPLRGVDGFAQALREEYAEQLDETAIHYLRRIQAAAQRMGELIDDLLDLSRLSRSDMLRAEVDLSGLAEGVVASLQAAQPEREVNVRLEPHLTVQGDRRMFKIALENLLGNAWKFTQQQTAAEIVFGRTAEGVYYVRDNGAGFDMAYADKLFAPFQRLHGSQEFEGTGIGLATVQRVVHRHGGTIWAESAPGQGAAFYFTLPEEFGALGASEAV